jgi:hypothetical protein
VLPFSRCSLCCLPPRLPTIDYRFAIYLLMGPMLHVYWCIRDRSHFASEASRMFQWQVLLPYCLTPRHLPIVPSSSDLHLYRVWACFGLSQTRVLSDVASSHISLLGFICSQELFCTYSCMPFDSTVLHVPTSKPCVTFLVSRTKRQY